MANGVADIVAGAKQRQLDPFAVIAVAMTEGLSGGIGDNGHSFGPFQLNDAGGAFPAQVTGTPQQKNAWAWSAAGIKYALDGIASVAAGQKGQQAVTSIVTRFERPKNPTAEIGRAGANYANLTKYTGGNPDQIATHVLTRAVGPDAWNASINSVVRHVPGVAQAEDIGSFLGKLTDPSYLLRGLQIVAGGALVGTGLLLLARQVALAADLPDPAKAVPAAATVAAL